MSLNVCQFLVIVFVAGEMLMVKVLTSAVSGQKRSDDGGPLQAVVEHLSQQVSSLTAQLTQQAHSFNIQLNAIRSEVAALTTLFRVSYHC